MFLPIAKGKPRSENLHANIQRTHAVSKNFSCSDAIREKMKKNYLSNPSYNYEIVNRASLACGPMVKWAIAQVKSVLWESKWNVKSEPEGMWQGSKGSEFTSIQLNFASYFASKTLVEGSYGCIWVV